jgi:UPF0271 protein
VGRTIDLNCDMGESFGPWKMGSDAEVMPHITSANVACGAHAGDPNVMAATVALARHHGVAVGAHPGFPDLQGFGRRAMHFSADEIVNLVLYQLGALWAMARAAGVELHHVKPHGALYNMACADAVVARPIVKAVRAFSPALAVYCLPASRLEEEALNEGLTTIPEGFVDRAYEPFGSLVDRHKPGAVASEPSFATRQALQLASGSVTCADGATLRLQVRTLCVHGDTPGAAQIARDVRAALIEAGYHVSSTLNG